MFNHIRKWNSWQRCNKNSIWWKILVLFGLGVSPTFELFKTSNLVEDDSNA